MINLSQSFRSKLSQFTTISSYLLLSLLPCWLLSLPAQASNDKILNLYAWIGEIPDEVIHQFTQETGITVNLSTYENNEIMYTKILSRAQTGYDIVMPSGYLVNRMGKQQLLIPLDKSKLTHWHHLDPTLLHPQFDPDNRYSVPYLWGVTGIFINRRYFPKEVISQWSDLWHSRYRNQLMLLDDQREVFAMGLFALGYSPNANKKAILQKTFQHLKKLSSNIKVFSSDTVISLMIDEDATIGMSWNGDAFKASQENKEIHFIFPKDGFIIWIDNLAIPRRAPHLAAAYQFMNFILRPDIAKKIACDTHYAIANLTARQQLPLEIRHNPILYPTDLTHAHFQKDLSDRTLALYENYWERLKMNSE